MRRTLFLAIIVVAAGSAVSYALLFGNSEADHRHVILVKQYDRLEKMVGIMEVPAGSTRLSYHRMDDCHKDDVYHTEWPSIAWDYSYRGEGTEFLALYTKELEHVGWNRVLPDSFVSPNAGAIFERILGDFQAEILVNVSSAAIPTRVSIVATVRSPRICPY